jgi:hypothetical protein
MEPAVQTKPPQAAKNFFLYFLNFALLYTVAINFGGALFAFIDRTFPLVGNTMFDPGALRFFMASLIIGTPIFLLLTRKIYLDALKDESLKHSGIRRWLTYITLIVTSLTGIGDLIALVVNLLNGETTPRFLLKVLTILVIAGGVFFYYLKDIQSLKQIETPKKSLLPKIYFFTSGVLILIVIITGFFFLPSPATQRLASQDDTRIMNLQSLENSIDQYALVHNGSLPKTLQDMTLVVGSDQDPVTKQPYVYQIADATHFKICATFATSNKIQTDKTYPMYDTSWLHGVGQTCFDRVLPLLDYTNGKPVPIVPAPAQ